MNIKTGTAQELAGLLRACDDEADNHVVWVAFNGDVHLDKESVFESTNPKGEYVSKTRIQRPSGIYKFDSEAYEYAVKGKMEYRAENAGTSKFMFQFETLCCGNGYTGEAAASDLEWVNMLLKMLKKDYESGIVGLSQFA